MLKGKLGTLKIGRDCTIDYPETIKEAGTYTLTIQGKGNYTGIKTKELIVTQKNFITKATVTYDKTVPFSESEIRPDVVVKIKGKGTLVKDRDYTVEYKDNTEIGTATIVIKGIGEYCGTKSVTFKITGTNIKNATVTGIPKSVTYTGEEIKIDPSKLELKVNGKVLKESDYEITYSGNANKGKGTIIFSGKNAYTGTLKKTFTISAYNIKNDDTSLISVEPIGTVNYEKGGSKPKIEVKFGDKRLEEGIDYTLKYKNHTSVTTGKTSTKNPTITITGKGNFTGSRTLNFEIDMKDLSDLTATAENKVYSKKKNAYKSIPVVVDKNGQKLVVGKDFNVTYHYYKSETELGDPVGAKDIPAIGTKLVAVVEGKGNYKGNLSCEYAIAKTNIKKAQISIPIANQIYTGREIRPDMDDFELKIGDIVLGENDYKIVSYSKNNTNVGTASVTVQGIGEYGGSKTITFKIKAKNYSD